MLRPPKLCDQSWQQYSRQSESDTRGASTLSHQELTCPPPFLADEAQFVCEVNSLGGEIGKTEMEFRFVLGLTYYMHGI